MKILSWNIKRPKINDKRIKEITESFLISAQT